MFVVTELLRRPRIIGKLFDVVVFVAVAVAVAVVVVVVAEAAVVSFEGVLESELLFETP